jgi:putative transposase
MKQSTSKPRIVTKAQVAQDVLPLVSQPEHALPLLGMLAQAQLSIEDLLGQISKGFIEQLLVLSAEQVAGAKHPGRHVGDVRWHGTQAGQVNIGKAKLKVLRPRLRGSDGEVGIPAYQALAADERLSQRVADILTCGISTRKYERAVHRCHNELGISKSAVSRQHIKESARALAALRERRYDKLDIVAVFMDGLIVGKQHILAALGLDASGHKHLLGLVAGSSENARVAKDLLEQLREQGLDLDEPRLWVIDGSKALASAIGSLCGQAAKVQRCQIHKIRNVTERLPKDMREQVAWRMKAAFGLQPVNGMGRLKALAQELKAQHPDAAASVLEGLEQMFTAATLGVQGPLARSLSNTNIIESPNSVVRRHSQRVTNFQNADMALRWTVMGFLESERGMRRIKGFALLPQLIRALRPQQEQKLAA